MSKQFWAIVAVIVVILIGIFALTNHSSGGTATSSSSNKPSEHIEGEGKDGVTLVEYGDYQCPYCGEYYTVVKQIQAEYNTQMSFQFRNFPLTSLHQNAFAGARAAEAAALQGKFWQMHDLLYEANQEYYDSDETINNWISASNPETYFDQYASQLGLNVKKFEADYASEAVDNTINADMAAGNKLNIDATPTFILDGKQVQVADSASAFEKLINAAIAAKTTGTTSTTTSSGTTAQTKE